MTYRTAPRPPASEDGSRTALLRELSGSSLRRLRSLADGLVERVWDDVYVPVGPVAKDDLWRLCHSNLGGILRTLDGDRQPRRVLRSAAESTGERRARQHCPLEWVQHAWWVGGQVIWEDFAEQVGSDDAGGLRELVASATNVWTVVDESAAVMATTYWSVEHELLGAPDRRVEELTDAALDGRFPEVPGEWASALGLPSGSRYVVVATDRVPGIGLAQAAVRLRAAGLPTVWRHRSERCVGIAAAGRNAPDAVVFALQDVLPGRAGVSPELRDIAEVPRAWRLAEMAMNTVPLGTGRVVTLDECLPDALLLSSPQLAKRLVDVTVGPLFRLPAAERDELLATTAAWIRSAGSAVQAARELYCHRNTVLNRLTRIQRLTGLYVTDTGRWSQVMLALSALRYHGEDLRSE